MASAGISKTTQVKAGPRSCYRAVTAVICSALLCSIAGAAPTMTLSPDGSYLVDQTGSPIFINGDTAWALIAQPTDAEIEIYLNNRQSKGYNAIIVSLIEAAYAANAPRNVLGVAPFSGEPFATPNEAYFARADWIIQQAAARGITVLLAPIYLGYDCRVGGDGWCAAVRSASASVMRNYGRYLGARYKDQPNIIWMIGGDMNPFAFDVDDKLVEIIAGIKEFDTDHLMTAHTGPEESAQDLWGTAEWLDLNTVYTYLSAGTHVKAAAEYNRANALPLFLLETAYENEHNSTPLSLRASAYHAVLWGATLGHFFGNCPIWLFGTPGWEFYCRTTDWRSELDSEASTTVAYTGNLMRSRRHWLMRPDHANTVMTQGHGSGSTRAVASRASDGSSVIGYIPTRRSVTIDMSEVAGSTARAWWWNPRANTATSIGVFPTTGSQSFTPPDANDWVLVIDDASQNFSPPGAAVVSASPPMPPTNLTVQ